MALAYFLVFFFLISHQLLLSLSEQDYNNLRCPPFSCGFLGSISFPFSNRTHPECGLLIVDNCTQSSFPTIQLAKNEAFFYVQEISQDNSLLLFDHPLFSNYTPTCKSLRNWTIPRSPFLSLNITSWSPPFKCQHNHCTIPKNYRVFCNSSNYSVIIHNLDCSKDQWNMTPPSQCSVIWPRVTQTQKLVVFHDIYTGGWFQLQVNVTRECHECHRRGGQCKSDSKGNFYCTEKGTKITASTVGHHTLGKKLELGIEIGVPTLLVGVLALYVTRRCKKGEYAFPIFHPRYTSSDPSSKSDPEEASVYFGVPIFSYCELAEATNNFNHEKELGNGGFGTVYHGKNINFCMKQGKRVQSVITYNSLLNGQSIRTYNSLLNGLIDPCQSGKLRDGREVAVKRLYENNYRRVEQFMNEIKILTRLRHKNLVSLYGCTSRHSQGLLLVYEFIPNGTVANHLHGDRANPCLLTWPIRMNIAIETALALAYLHASDIIHRDVKTNNLLLDNNFSVKVVDFGLSRLFPTDVTHVSTAPQGTAGYVDPEYHQCYQLTDKSDVYSFGVVLIELISSMPAVDVSRHKHEINLANLAINKIQKRAVEELIDPCLGFHLDEEVKRMATSVAELAFQCLQHNKEMRPSMDAVLEQLLRIKSGEYKPENQKEEDDDDKEELKSMQQQPPPPPLHYEETSLLKNIEMATSPISVTENWASKSTASNVSN